jgi:NADPH-dependent curcumin reductase CurA
MQQVIFKSRPDGWVSEDNFALQAADIPAPGPGQMLIRNIYMSVDPYMRGMMDDKKSYAAPLKPGDVLPCRVIGEVMESNHPGYAPGEFVFAMLRWQEYSLADGSEDMRKVDPDLAPISWNLGVLGAPGLTAYVGMIHFGQPKAGEQVFVSAAAGAVGQIAGQLAKMQGARVVGSAGSDAKVAFLRDDIGLDGAFNYRNYAGYGAALDEFFPDYIDVYFDNVGGEALDEVLARVNPFARCIECGMISQYNRTEPYGMRNLTQINRMRVTMQGFIVRDHFDMLPKYLTDMAGWLEDGKIRYVEDIAEGLENAPGAFIRMLKGENFGKQVVRIGADPTRR